MDREEARGNTGPRKEKVQLSHFNTDGGKEERGQRIIKDGSQGSGEGKGSAFRRGLFPGDQECERMHELMRNILMGKYTTGLVRDIKIRPILFFFFNKVCPQIATCSPWPFGL